MATVTAPQTRVVETVKVATFKKAEELAKKLGRALGSPINGKEVGQQFPVTLTGNIEIREFNGQKGAYFTTKEGYSIRVNASFDPAKHKEGTTHTAICRELVTENRSIKFCAFVD